jgi:hypothetical protein
MKRCAGHVHHVEYKNNSYNLLYRKPSGMRPFGRPEFGWEGNIKLDLNKCGMTIRLIFTWLRIESNHGVLLL